jgi:hypothetical protein
MKGGDMGEWEGVRAMGDADGWDKEMGRHTGEQTETPTEKVYG